MTLCAQERKRAVGHGHSNAGVFRIRPTPTEHERTCALRLSYFGDTCTFGLPLPLGPTEMTVGRYD